MVYQVFAEGKGSFVVRLIDGGQLVKFTSPDAEQLVKSLNAAVSAWQNQQPVSVCVCVCLCVCVSVCVCVCVCVHTCNTHTHWLSCLPPQSRYMTERKMEPKDVPGTFLNLVNVTLHPSPSPLPLPFPTVTSTTHE